MWITEKLKKWLGGPAETRMMLVNSTNNAFYAWDGNLYQSDIIRACIRPFYKACGKLVAKQIRETEKSGIKINPDIYIRRLLEEPNPYMTGQMLQEKLAIQFKLNNNAFAYIARDSNGYATEIYPIPASSVRVHYDKLGMLYLDFTMRNGKTWRLSYGDVIHIRQDYNENDIFGTSNVELLRPLMEIVQTTDTGIIKSIQNGAVIRWLLKFSSRMADADRRARGKEFAKSYLNMDNETQVAVLDGTMDAKQVEPNDNIPNAAQMDKTTTRIYNVFGVNEAIIQAKYNEDQWNAYYESEIEPFASQLAREMTRKIFSAREIGFGNRIIFEASSLQYASMSTKLNLVQMIDRGAMTPNEWRKIMNLGPIDGGDIPVRRLDTAPVNDVPVKVGD